MNFTDAVVAVFKKYFDFSSRSLRSEYWYWVLFGILASFALGIIDNIIFGTRTSSTGPLGGLFALGTFIPGLAVGIRRLHDINKSGWWVLLALTIVGLIPLIYWACQPGTPGKNNYGGPAPTKP